MMKKVFALLLAAVSVLSLAACGNSGSESKGDSSADTTAAKTTEAAAETTAQPASSSAAVDISSWKWTKGELDCYNYGDCYMSFEYPESFKTCREDSSGLQYRGYYFNPGDPGATANSAPYGIYMYFNQGAFGAKRSTLEADVQGGFTECDLGGRKVLFGESKKDENTGSYTFSYYTSYYDDEYARIWFLVCDPEEDGQFRKTFEQSISFAK